MCSIYILFLHMVLALGHLFVAFFVLPIFIFCIWCSLLKVHFFHPVLALGKMFTLNGWCCKQMLQMSSTQSFARLSFTSFMPQVANCPNSSFFACSFYAHQPCIHCSLNMPLITLNLNWFWWGQWSSPTSENLDFFWFASSFTPISYILHPFNNITILDIPFGFPSFASSHLQDALDMDVYHAKVLISKFKRHLGGF